MTFPRFNIDPDPGGHKPPGGRGRSEEQSAALVNAMQRMAREEAGGLDDFFHLCGDSLFTFAARALGSRHDAEEIVQDTLVRVWNKASSYDPARSHPFTWTMLILRGLVADRLRARQCRITLVAQDPTETSLWSASPDPWTGGSREDWETAWAELTELEKITLQQAIFTPATAEQIARELGEPLGTIKARIRRGLAKLRQILFWEHPL